MQSSQHAATARSVNAASDDKPIPKDFSHYYSVITNHRFPSPMKEYYKFFQIPGIGNLAGGLPNLRFFPFDTLEAQTAKPERWTPSPNEPPAAATTGGVDDLMGRAASLNLNNSRRDASGDGDSGSQAATHITVPKVLSPDTDVLKKIDLATALQYGTAQGYPPLFSFLKQFTREALHPNVPYQDGADIVLDVGSTDGFFKTLDLFVDAWSPETGDIRDRPGLLCETFVYGSILSQSSPRGMQFVPVKADEGGMVATGPGSLEDVLANWDYSKGRRPHLMYTVTMGHNPTGILLSLERRKQLYAVCSQFDVLIVEDDPYWYLQFPSAAIEEAKSRNRAPVADAFSASEGYHWNKETSSSSASDPTSPTTSSLPKTSGYAFLDSLVPSFLQIDTDGRVIRLDTFSKTVAPGCRLGWITAQPAIIERYLRATESSTQQPSGFVQSIISELVVGNQPAEVTKSWLSSLKKGRDNSTSFTGWQMDGWVRWIEGLRGEYERRMARMCRILDEGSVFVKQGTPRAAADADVCVLTKTQLFEYNWPRGGMFVWLRVLFENHPLYGAASSDGADIIDGSALSTAMMIYLTRKPHLVLVSPGTMFSATEDIRRSDGWRYFRLCFAAESEEGVDLFSKRFVKGVRKFWGIKTAKELEELLRGVNSLNAEEEREEMRMGNLGLYMGC